MISRVQSKKNLSEFIAYRLADVHSGFLWPFLQHFFRKIHCHVAVQYVSDVVNAAGSRDVDRDAADRKISSVYVYRGFHVCHPVSDRTEPHSEIVVHTHDAVARSPHLHRLTTATAVYAASCWSSESGGRLFTGTQWTSALRQSLQEGKTTCRVSAVCGVIRPKGNNCKPSNFCSSPPPSTLPLPQTLTAPFPSLGRRGGR